MTTLYRVYYRFKSKPGEPVSKFEFEAAFMAQSDALTWINLQIFKFSKSFEQEYKILYKGKVIRRV